MINKHNDNLVAERSGHYIATQFFYILLAIVVFIVINLQYKTDKKINKSHIEAAMDLSTQRRIESIKPETICYGNSIMHGCVHGPLFQKLTQSRTLKVEFGGSASAVWYLVLKNQIITAKHKPKNLILFFRDQYLTDPLLFTGGKYKARFIDKFSVNEEPLLQRLLYNNRMTTKDQLLIKHYPLYYDRNKIKTSILSWVKTTATMFCLDMKSNKAAAALKYVFKDEHMNPSLLAQAQDEAAEVKSVGAYDFYDNVATSFLPEIIRMTKENKINLILVRVKLKSVAEGKTQPKALLSYAKDLKTYLGDHHVPFIDYNQNEEITTNYFRNKDHFTIPEGQVFFTKILAKDVARLLK